MLKGYTKEEKSWMMYDWANSAHSVIVVTLLPIFFSSVAGFMRNTTSAMSIWGYVTSIAMLIWAILKPCEKRCFLFFWQWVCWPARGLPLRP